MKKYIALAAALLLVLPGCGVPRASGQQTNKNENKAAPPDAEARAQAAEVFKGLRNRVLTAPPEEVGFNEAGADAKVWAVLMEMAFPAGVATVLSTYDGTASLYTSTGGGILGGWSAREQAQGFVAEAGKHLKRMKPTDSYPYPAVGRIRFYARTPDGVYTAEAGEEELVGRRHPLSPLFYAANEVLTGLRKASEQAEPGAKP